jgi:ADP-heptose:LPS heptosyltransferase
LARRLERGAKRHGSKLLAALVPARRITAAELRAAPVRHLLVVRQHNQMGDMVCALPALRALRRAFPDAHLTFLTAPLCQELLRGHPDIDRLLVFRKFSMWLPWRLVEQIAALRRPRPDLAVVMTTVSFSTTSALLAWASGARLRVGASSLPFGWHLSRAAYNLELPLGPDSLHEVEHNLAPLRALGIEAPVELPRLEARPEALRRARDFVARDVAAPEQPGAPLVVVHAGAGKRPNMWPAASFAAVLQGLRQRCGARVVLIEGPTDAAAVAAVAQRLEGAARWRAPLDDTFGLLALADLVLSNDTGLAHVAGAVGAPTLVLFGPTDVQRWKPPGDHVRAAQSPTGDIGDLPVETVLGAALDILAARRPASAPHPPPAAPRPGAASRAVSP